MRNGRLRRRVWVAVAFGLLGCGSDDEGTERLGPDPVPALGCEDQSFETCNIGDSGCRRRIFSTVRCLRGNEDAELPPVRTISVEEYEAEVTASYEAIDEQDEVETGFYERAFVLLGLATIGDFSAEQQVSLATNTVAAYYSSANKDVTIIERDGSEDDTDATLTLAHEFVHALQDQEHDLTRLSEAQGDAYDAYLALRCLTEGEAVLYEGMFSVAVWGLTVDQVDFRAHFMASVPWAEEQLADQSPILASPRYFPYTYGGRYVFNAFDRGGRKGVNDLFGAPPNATLPVMLSETELVSLETEPVAPAAGEAPEGLELLSEDVLGAWIVGKFLLEQGASPTEPQVALEWRGDRLEIYVSETSGVAVRWQVRLSSAEARERFLAPLQDAYWRVAYISSLGDDVVEIRAAEDKAVLAAWVEQVSAGPALGPVLAEDTVDSAALGLSHIVERRRGVMP